jgi:hypothetical protein
MIGEMKQSLDSIAALSRNALVSAGHAATADHAAQRCTWLEACGYPGLTLLQDALADVDTTAVLERDALGLDLQGVSCVFVASDVERLVREHGRLFLRNVRHGLYLLPGSVTGNYGIGCPVDPGFPLGGERSKNPYAEKLEAAAREGVEVDDQLWQSLAGPA